MAAETTAGSDGSDFVSNTLETAQVLRSTLREIARDLEHGNCIREQLAHALWLSARLTREMTIIEKFSRPPRLLPPLQDPDQMLFKFT